MIKRRLYVVVAAYGYGNPGDDACAVSARYLILKSDPTAKVIITSPPFDEELVKNADAVILGGGGTLYDLTSENVTNYMKYLEYAQQHKKLTAAIGIGTQGIHTDWGKKYYNKVLNKCNLVTTRSFEDTAVLHEIGVKKAITTQDLGFVVDDAVFGNTQVKRNILRLMRIKDRVPEQQPTLGLSLIDFTATPYGSNLIGKEEFDELAKGCRLAIDKYLPKLKECYGVKLIIQSRDDRKYCEELSRRFNIKILDYKSPSDLPNLLRNYAMFDAIFTMRFHPIIFGSLSNKPVFSMAGPGSKHEKLISGIDSINNHQEVISQNSIEKHLERVITTEHKPISLQDLQNMKRLALMNIGLLRNMVTYGPSIQRLPSIV
ncbi:MAG: polysaccharide pyruvyl transferase family protein [bacterium]|nr:polysaccharide pyruvyl transferase family protein [bacterium]